MLSPARRRACEPTVARPQHIPPALILALAAALGTPACSPTCSPTCSNEREPAEQPQPAPAATHGNDPIDVHVHLTRGAARALVDLLDDVGVARAVVLASPHLDIAQSPATLGAYDVANDMVLAAAADHPGRFIPFITIELGATEPGYVRAMLERGACGVKIYQGHRALRERPLAHPDHHPVLALLEQRQVPLLLHLNTVRFRDDLTELMARFPKLRVACAHLCGSRTDLDRLAGIMAAHPTLLFDTSHGGAAHAAAGFANLERERERFTAMIESAPERFLFGSDLVTDSRVQGWRQEWLMQVRANLDFLRAQGFRFWRRSTGSAALTVQDYRGLALNETALAPVLRKNAERWLAPCSARASR